MAASWNDLASTSYRFMRVSRKTGYETEEIPCLKGGTVTRNDDTRIKESATATMVEEYDFGPDFVRIYIDGVTHDGSKLTDCLGTFLPVTPSRTINGPVSQYSLQMYGRLQELLDDQFPSPYTVASGSNAVAAVKKICEDSGLTVVVVGTPTYTVTDSRYYGVGATQQNSEVGDTKLDAINDLLDLANYRSANTDVYGRIVLEPYYDADNIAASATFAPGASSSTVRFERSMEYEADYTSTANHVVVRYSSTEKNKTIAAEAWDKSETSPYSTVNRGRTITSSYTYEELPPGNSDAEMQKYANNRAKTLLATAQSVIKRITFSCPYVRLGINDTVNFSYPAGNVSGKFQVRTMTLSLKGGCPTEIEARRYTRRTS